jgi:hypothetical protein
MVSKRIQKETENIGIDKNRESRVFLIQKFGMENIGKLIKTIKEIVKQKEEEWNRIESLIYVSLFL